MVGFHSSMAARITPRSSCTPERQHLVAELAQRLDDVVLHLPRRGEDVDVRRVGGRHEVLVHEREHALRLHSATRCPPLCR